MDYLQSIAKGKEFQLDFIGYRKISPSHQYYFYSIRTENDLVFVLIPWFAFKDSFKILGIKLMAGSEVYEPELEKAIIFDNFRISHTRFQRNRFPNPANYKPSVR